MLFFFVCLQQSTIYLRCNTHCWYPAKHFSQPISQTYPKIYNKILQIQKNNVKASFLPLLKNWLDMHSTYTCVSFCTLCLNFNIRNKRWCVCIMVMGSSKPCTWAVMFFVGWLGFLFEGILIICIPIPPPRRLAIQGGPSRQRCNIPWNRLDTDTL